MANRFTEYVFGALPKDPPLPLMHTLDAYTFRETLESGELKPWPCTVFKDDKLVYLFYGRPAYRPRAGESPTSLNTFYPVSILMRPEFLPTAKRVFPFDSGAFTNRLYSEHVDYKRMNLDSFLIDPDPVTIGNIPIPETPARVVSSFFGENKAYYLGAVKDPIRIPPFDFEVQCYHELIRSKSRTEHDDRRGTIEIQIEEPIALSVASVWAVVLPWILYEDKEVVDKISKWKTEVIPYASYHERPSHFIIAIIENVWQFLGREGLL